MKNPMFICILLSLILGIVAGIYFPEQMLSIRWIGTIFINLLKLIVLPLIFCALVSAITSMQDIKKLGSVGAYTITYVLFSVSLAVTIGLLLLNIFKPGVGMPPDLILASATTHDLPTVGFSSFLLSLFPPNIIDAAAKFEIMPVVFFSIVFAIACLNSGESAKPVISFFIGLRNVFIKMITWLMYLTPIGLFALLSTAIAEASLQHRLVDSVKGMLAFIFVFLFGLFLQIFWQFLVIKYISYKRQRSAKEFLSHATQPMITAFATSSSMATLPVALMAAKKQQVNDEVARFVLPFATTINLAGTAMYEAVSTLFFCQILGIDLSVTSQIGVFIVAILAGMGATGIPEGGLVTMVMVLRSVNIPTAAIGLLLPFDRILDRFRTMTNLWGDLVCATTVDYLSAQKEKTIAANYYVKQISNCPS